MIIFYASCKSSIKMLILSNKYDIRNNQEKRKKEKRSACSISSTFNLQIDLFFLLSLKKWDNQETHAVQLSLLLSQTE